MQKGFNCELVRGVHELRFNRLCTVDTNWRHMVSPRHILAIYSGDRFWRMPELGGLVG